MKEIKSIYIHFPFCLKKCNYCDFFSSSFQITKSDIDSFEKVIALQLDKLQKDILPKSNHQISSLKSIYLGGGTPSLWGERGASYLKEFLKNVSLEQGCEITLEVNPGTIDDFLLSHWLSAGVNRFSIGVQAFDAFFNSKLERAHSIEQVETALTLFQERGLNFSVDLMLGLPFEQEKERDYLGELDKILAFNPKHLSVYILSPPVNYCYQDKLPDEEYIAKSYIEVANKLKNAGFVHYEVSNFAKPNFESVHNFQYWKTENVLALGPSATGFHDGYRYRWGVDDSFDFEETLNLESAKLENFYMQIRTNLGLDLTQWFDESTCKSIYPFFEQWKLRGYLDSNWPYARLNSLGYLFIDSIMEDIFNIKKSFIIR